MDSEKFLKTQHKIISESISCNLCRRVLHEEQSKGNWAVQKNSKDTPKLLRHSGTQST